MSQQKSLPELPAQSQRRRQWSQQPRSTRFWGFLLLLSVAASLPQTSAVSCPQCVKDAYPLSFPVWRQVFGYVAFVLTIFLVAACMIGLSLRKKLYPLSGRSYPLLMIYCVGILFSLGILYREFAGEPSMDCGIKMWTQIMFFPLCGGAVVLRIVRVVRKSNFENLKHMQFDQRTLQGSDGLGLAAFAIQQAKKDVGAARHAASTRRLLRWMYLFIAFSLLWGIIRHTTQEDMREGRVGCPTFSPEIAFQLVFSIAIILFCVPAYFKLRKLKLGFELAAELRWLIGFIGGGLIVLLVLQLAGTMTDLESETFNFIQRYVTWGVPVLGLLVQVMWPMLRTFKTHNLFGDRRKIHSPSSAAYRGMDPEFTFHQNGDGDAEYYDDRLAIDPQLLEDGLGAAHHMNTSQSTQDFLSSPGRGGQQHQQGTSSQANSPNRSQRAISSFEGFSGVSTDEFQKQGAEGILRSHSIQNVVLQPDPALNAVDPADPAGSRKTPGEMEEEAKDAVGELRTSAGGPGSPQRPSALKIRSRRKMWKDVELEDILQHELGKKLFAEHLHKEWSLENLMFWEAVQTYIQVFEAADQTLLNPEDGISAEERQRQVQTIAEHILEDYIEDNGPWMVNISSVVRRRILGDVENHRITRNLFEQGCQEIWHLMAADSFRRFAEDKLFRQLRRETVIYGSPEHRRSFRSSVSGFTSSNSQPPQTALSLSRLDSHPSTTTGGPTSEAGDSSRVRRASHLSQLEAPVSPGATVELQTCPPDHSAPPRQDESVLPDSNNTPAVTATVRTPASRRRSSAFLNLFPSRSKGDRRLSEHSELLLSPEEQAGGRSDVLHLPPVPPSSGGETRQQHRRRQSSQQQPSALYATGASPHNRRHSFSILSQHCRRTPRDRSRPSDTPGDLARSESEQSSSQARQVFSFQEGPAPLQEGLGGPDEGSLTAADSGGGLNPSPRSAQPSLGSFAEELPDPPLPVQLPSPLQDSQSADD